MLERFWELVGWVFALNGEAFRVASTLPYGTKAAILLVVLAGLSQEIGQSIILFLNQVKPVRFVFSLLLSAILFVFGFLALVGSTWLITLVPSSVTISFGTLVTVLGLSYAPLLFSFLGAMPYLGLPLLNLLNTWNLLAMVVGFGAVTGLSTSQAFGYVAFGWVVLQILQQTIGRPLADLAKRLTNAVAGVDLVTDRRGIQAAMRTELEQVPTRWKAELEEHIAEVKASLDAIAPTPLAATTTAFMQSASAMSEAAVTTTVTTAPAKGADRSVSRMLHGLLWFLAVAVLTAVVIFFLRPVRDWLFGWYSALPSLFRWIFDLVWIALVAIVVAGLLAPLETLGWWAGWYDDDIDTTLNAGELAQPVEAEGEDLFSRYIVYLDGIGKSTYEYLPDIEEFLDTLAPTLPEHVALVRGIMPYSVMNKPLDEDRPLAFLWKYADKLRFANPASLLGLLVNIRNVLIVGVSADKRYGPLYNQGIAQVVYNGLVKNGYQPGSGTPVTFIGYSGGGQMSCAAAPYLKRAISAPIDVISLGGVISANNNLLKLEHLYHLVGDKDGVEQIGPILFPGRWKLFPLSYWNRAKRLGKITFIPMGPVGHQVPGGILDPKLILADGRSALTQTIDTLNAILNGKLLEEKTLMEGKPSNYSRYRQAAFNRPEFYPIPQAPNPACYRPIGPWMGRLILPTVEERSQVKGVWFEVAHAPAPAAALIGQVVPLRWSRDPRVQTFVKAVTKDVHFSADAEHSSQYGGSVHPVRLNHWPQVNPLESLAGAHPVDDLTVMLEEVEVRQITSLQAPGVTAAALTTALYTRSQPIEITGWFYGLVQFVAPVAEGQYRVRHFDRVSRQFDGPEETVAAPPALLAEAYGSYPSTMAKIEQSPYNETGWYVYGAQDAAGQFTVRSLCPRALISLKPERVIFGQRNTYRYIRQETWKDIRAKKGQIASVLCTAHDSGRASAVQDAIAAWQVGDRALVLHVYGGIGGDKSEPAAATPIFFGHFAYGVAEVVRDPLADELRFDIRYYQVYTQNTDGLVAGTLHWSRYLGDRQFGWLGNRPTCDLLVKLDCFTGDYAIEGDRRSPLRRMEAFLQAMTARYRIGDGTGGTYVGPANNCSQDSNQALFASIQQMGDTIRVNETLLRQWAEQNPNEAVRFRRLMQFGKELKASLQPFGKPRPDWEKSEFNLGSTLEDQPLRNLAMGLGSWRTLLPRKASDTVVKVFIDYGADVWVLRTNQVGGYDPDIAPIAPMTL